jgi:putative glutamine amidotransferase
MPCPHGKIDAASCSICVAKQKSVVVAPALQVKIRVPALALSAQQWIDRFRPLAKHFTEQDFKLMRRVLDTLAEQGLEVQSEKDLQTNVMAAVVEMRRPKLLGKPVCIGIPYRDDQNSMAIFEDVRRLRDGSLCDVVVLVSPIKFGKWTSQQIVAWIEQNGFTPWVLNSGTALRMYGLDAIYVSGGPHDHPSMQGTKKNSSAGTNRELEADDRHAFEERVIQAALDENLPLLGICGGSWRLASLLGGVVQRLGAEEKTHAKPMTEPFRVAHTVKVEPLSMLNQVLQTDNYRLGGSYSTPSGDSATVYANSVHWAQSVFPIGSPLQPPLVKVTARSPDGVTEAFEKRGAHFVMGVQWHPEYAMDGLSKGNDANKHRQVLRALGDAARDGKAATILQKHMRGFLIRKLVKKMKSSQTTPVTAQ